MTSTPIDSLKKMMASERETEALKNAKIKITKEGRRSSDSIKNLELADIRIINYKSGHEAATERLLPILERAIAMAEFYKLKSNYSVVDEGRNYNTENVVYELDENTYADTELGTKAREFLASLKNVGAGDNEEGE